MNIKEHIEAGHYPATTTCYLGGAQSTTLVPMRNGRIATIYSTEHGGEWPIAGSIADDGCINGRGLRCWKADGRISDSSISGENLMPPVPRKVRITAYAIVTMGGRILRLSETPPSGVATGIEKLIELSEEIEVPWS